MIKHISGYLELNYKDRYNDEDPDFAFIGDYYVHKTVLEKYDITSNCHVNAKVVYTGDDKWKVYERKRDIFYTDKCLSPAYLPC